MKKIDQIKEHMQYLIMFREVFNLGTRATAALEFAYDLILEEFYKEAQREQDNALRLKAEREAYGYPHKKLH
jgi:hypothetical protein